MKHTLDDGRIITIPDEEIKKSMSVLGLSKADAINLYLDDNGLSEGNEEQDLLDEFASEVKIEHGAKSTEKKKRKSSPRTYVYTDEKILVYEAVKQALETVANKVGGTLQELTKQKLLEITFPDNDRPIKVDIIQKRATK